MYTDGITEYCLDKEFYGRKRLESAIALTRQLPLESACQHIIDSVHEFGAGKKADDDITLVGLEFLGEEH